MKRIIKAIEEKYLLPSLNLVEDVFTAWDNEKEDIQERHDEVHGFQEGYGCIESMRRAKKKNIG